MTPDRWKRIEEVFQAAADLAGPEREAYLAQTCGGDAELLGEVQALLKSDDEAQGFIERQVEDGVMSLETVEMSAKERRAGPYRLTRELGRGGMGTVYLGERADGEYEGEVAVKLVRRGMDTEFFLARFKRERQALARLQHPNIARLLDSGTTEDGSPYIVMERVDGRPINAYCKAENLSIDATLRLYLQVCRAVAHAHHNFVVHRDLKPGNILVDTTGAPKLLDFGICKLLIGGAAGARGNAEAVETTHMMTPDYASPEQVSGDPITVASDIYSLGAVLYELLTGKRPHAIEKYTPQHVAEAVCDRDVTKPSEAALDRDRSRQLSGDLDTILLKAMQKEPSRRYESVEQFAEDLRRVLDHEPVLARPDTTMYRVRKFARRHMFGTAAASVAVVALAGTMAAYANQATVAKRESASARTLANAMMFEIHDRIKELPGSLEAREAIVRLGLNYLDRLLAEGSKDAALRREVASAYRRMGELQGSVLASNKGDTEGALKSYRSGLKALEPLGDTREAGLIRLEIHRAIGQVLNTRAPKEAIRNAEEAIAFGDRLHRKDPEDFDIGKRLAGLYQSAALTNRLAEQRQRALELALLAKDLFQQLIQKRPQDPGLRAELAGVTSNLGVIQTGLNQYPEARKSLESAIQQLEQLCSEEPKNDSNQRNRMLAYSHLAELLTNLNDEAGTVAAFRSMVDVAEMRYKAMPGDQGATFDYAMALGRWAGLKSSDAPTRLGLYERSTGLLAETLQRDPANGNARVNLAAQKESIGDLLLSTGRQNDGIKAYRESLRIIEERPVKVASGPRVAISVSAKLAEYAAKQGDSAQAIAMAKHTLSIAEKIGPSDPVATQILRARAYESMGTVQSLLRQPQEARQWRDRALTDYRAFASRPEFTKANRARMVALEKLLAEDKQ